MKSKKKILLLGPAHPYRGGIADTQNAFAKSLQENGHEVILFTFTFQYPKFLFPGKTQLTSNPAPTKLNIQRKIHSCNPFNWAKTARAINQINPDVVFFRYWTPFLALCWQGIAKRLPNKIKTIALVDNWLPHERKPWDNLLNNYFGKKMDGFATLSGHVGEQISSVGFDKPVWFGFHPIADDLLPAISKEEARDRLDWPQGKKIVLFFGLIRKYKGLDLLIKAFSKPPLKDKNVLLAIVGESYEDQEVYKNLISKLALNDHTLTDFNFADMEKARNAICAADVVAQTYRSATQSGVTPLAYQYQTPIVVSDIPGLKAPILTDDSGSVSSINSEDISSKITALIETDQLKHHINQIKKALPKYRWKTFSENLMTFIETL